MALLTSGAENNPHRTTREAGPEGQGGKGGSKEGWKEQEKVNFKADN